MGLKAGHPAPEDCVDSQELPAPVVAKCELQLDATISALTLTPRYVWCDGNASSVKALHVLTRILACQMSHALGGCGSSLELVFSSAALRT